MFRMYGMSIVILKCLTQGTNMHDKILRELKNYNLLLRNGLKELNCFILEILIILFFKCPLLSAFDALNKPDSLRKVTNALSVGNI